ncbi:MAG: class B sortase [Erysipelotrichaceae bacterium]|nr:class B sortase [Erysipelotrichaceae bacterium]
MSNYHPRHGPKDSRTRRRLQKEAELTKKEIENIEPELSAFEKNLSSVIDDFMKQLVEQEPVHLEKQEEKPQEEPAEMPSEETEPESVTEVNERQSEQEPEEEKAVTVDNSSDENDVQEAPEIALNEDISVRKTVVIVSCFLLIFVSFIWGAGVIGRNRKTDTEPVADLPEETEQKPVSMPADLKDIWLTNKAINSDYVGQIVFDSGLIDLPIVQAKDVYDRNGKPYVFYTEEGDLVTDPEDYTGNDVYIWTNWKTGEYDPHGEGGSVFMDFRNSLNDQNLIIYGHHFARDWDPSGTKLFTPLDALLEEQNYEANKTLKLILNNEIREYLITNVFTISIEDENELKILRRNMDEDYSGNADPGFFREFIKYIDGISRYRTSEQLKEEDNILTLVTCMQHQPELRQIIVAKETDRTLYE